MTLETMLKKYAISIKSTYEYIYTYSSGKKSNLEGYDTYSSVPNRNVCTFINFKEIFPLHIYDLKNNSNISLKLLVFGIN